ncbi:hypothetical protein T11_12963 [Trichinella zimbabwensis]|uniref:Uncharacterized protein n=1 Tax=Trichinella zimbabwensis TaxID=268475 RepID=A0A0V1HW04_9BILA|nr:hypothetical protein T11_12963 [Trichinella zimbabwensis]
MQIDRQANFDQSSFTVVQWSSCCKVTRTVNLPNVKWCSKTRSLVKTGLPILIDKRMQMKPGERA